MDDREFYRLDDLTRETLAKTALQLTADTPPTGKVRFLLLRAEGQVKAVIADVSHCRTTEQVKWAIATARELSAEYEKGYAKRN